MSLSGYSRAAFGIGRELQEMLEADAFAPMLDALTEKSVHTLVAFRRDEAALVETVATSQPKPRTKILAKLPVEKQFWTIAAAAQTAFEAAAVLGEVYRLQPGGSYRDMIGEVQRVLLAQYECPEAEWPFPTPSPFLKPDTDFGDY